VRSFIGLSLLPSSKATGGESTERDEKGFERPNDPPLYARKNYIVSELTRGTKIHFVEPPGWYPVFFFFKGGDLVFSEFVVKINKINYKTRKFRKEEKNWPMGVHAVVVASI